MSREDYVKLHYYCFSFTGADLEGNPSVMASSYIGLDYKDKINFARVAFAKEAAKVAPDSVLLGVSYLGHMTSMEFRGEA